MRACWAAGRTAWAVQQLAATTDPRRRCRNVREDHRTFDCRGRRDGTLLTGFDASLALRSGVEVVVGVPVDAADSGPGQQEYVRRQRRGHRHERELPQMAGAQVRMGGDMSLTEVASGVVVET
jgi:hypothetical protein